MKKRQLQAIQEQVELRRLAHADNSRRALFKNQGASHAPMWLTAAAALILSAISIGVLLPFKENPFAQLIIARGWVPYVLVFMMYWSYAILLVKLRLLGKQQDAMAYDLLPTKIAGSITVDDIPQFESHVRTICPGQTDNFLVTRIMRGLSHFQVRGNHAETAELLMSQSDIDAQTVHSSYSLVKVFIWAIPILGFIGTVVGISDAVGSFAGELGAADDISVLKDKLGLVTAGLGVAFDTTLLALVMSVLVMFPTSMLQTKEEALLTAIDDYTNENFLKRLDEEKEGGKMDKEDAGVQLELLASMVEQQEQILSSHREQIDLLRLLVSQQRNR
jgi:biopolymer transport protein ExbB/TolQ